MLKVGFAAVKHGIGMDEERAAALSLLLLLLLLLMLFKKKHVKTQPHAKKSTKSSKSLLFERKVSFMAKGE